MKNDKIKDIIIGILILIILGLTIFILIKTTNMKKESDNKTTTITDSVKFKEEYEKLNGEVNSNNQKEYPQMDISKDNMIKYLDVEEVLDILKDGTGVIYFGYPECPWCRNAVPVLLNAAQNTSLAQVYYYNANAIKNIKEVDDEGKIVETQKEKAGYRDLLKALDSILKEYTLTDKDGNTVHTGEKRIYVPLVVFVKDGKIIAHHEGTVDSQKDPYVLLNEEQKEELNQIYVDNITKTTKSSCDDKC